MKSPPPLFFYFVLQFFLLRNKSGKRCAKIVKENDGGMEVWRWRYGENSAEFVD